MTLETVDGVEQVLGLLAALVHRLGEDLGVRVVTGRGDVALGQGHSSGVRRRVLGEVGGATRGDAVQRLGEPERHRGLQSRRAGGRVREQDDRFGLGAGDRRDSTCRAARAWSNTGPNVRDDARPTVWPAQVVWYPSSQPSSRRLNASGRSWWKKWPAPSQRWISSCLPVGRALSKSAAAWAACTVSRGWRRAFR